MSVDNEIKDFGTRQTGMQVPEHYFDDFQMRMERLIDEVAQQQTPVVDLTPKVSLWTRVKPWMYMAAMFISFVVVFRVFLDRDDSKGSMATLSNNEEQLIFDDALVSSVSDYDLYESFYANAE